MWVKLGYSSGEVMVRGIDFNKDTLSQTLIKYLKKSMIHNYLFGFLDIQISEYFCKECKSSRETILVNGYRESMFESDVPILALYGSGSSAPVLNDIPNLANEIHGWKHRNTIDSTATFGYAILGDRLMSVKTDDYYDLERKSGIGNIIPVHVGIKNVKYISNSVKVRELNNSLQYEYKLTEKNCPRCNKQVA